MAPPANKTKDAAPKAKAGKKSSPAPAEKPASPVDAEPKVETPPEDIGPVLITYSGTGKPDKAAYDAEQEVIKREIEKYQTKVNALKDKIGQGSKGGPGAERRAELKAELDRIREQQGDVKGNRDKIFTQLKALQETIQKKVADLQNSKSKLKYKSTAELDAHISSLQQQIDSGSLTVLVEKRTIQEITTAKRQRKIIEGFQSEQDAIDADRAKVDELKGTLDNPESKALSERFDVIKAELDEIKKEGDAVYASRNVLFAERDQLQKVVDALYTKKRESTSRWREASDVHYAKQQEERAKRAERAKAARQAVEDEKKKETVERLREEAEIPAYQAEIEDCQNLIDYFSGTVTVSATGLENTRSKLSAVPELSLRQVELDTKGLIEVKRAEEEEFFVSSKKSKKGGKAKAAAEPSAERFSVPLAKLSALASLSIPPPATAADIPRTIENLKTKKEWLVANQVRQTEANKAKAEKEIARLLHSLELNQQNGATDAPEAAATEEAVAV